MRAFDANGNVFLLSVQEETDIPVIILNSCERLGIEAKTTPLLIDKSGSDEWNDPTTGSGTTTNTSINSSPQFVKSYKFYFPKKMKLRYGFKGAGNEGVDLLKLYYSDRAEAKYGFWFNRVENFFECIIGKTKSAKFLNQKCKKNLTCIVSF